MAVTGLLPHRNLSDVDSAATSRTNLGLGTGDSPTFAGATFSGVVNGTSVVLSGSVSATDASGSNVAATNLVIQPGQSTGNATPAKVIIQTTVAGSSGSTPQTLADLVTFQGATMTVAGTVSAATLFSSGGIAASSFNGISSKTYFDSTTDGQICFRLWADSSKLFEFNSSATTSTLGTTRYMHLPNLQVDGVIKPASLADAAAGNNSIYFSTDASKLVYKDSGGTVNALY